MRRAPAFITLLALASSALPPFALAEDEVEISMDDVPELVLDTAIRTAPGVTFDRVSVEDENGVAVYEFEAEDHQGRHIEIDVTENGDLEEIEIETDWEDLPDAVVATLNATAPGFEPSYIELSIRDGSRAFVYEFEGALAGDFIEIHIDEGGELVFSTADFSS